MPSGGRINQWVVSGTSTANTAQTVTQAAPPAGQRHVVTGWRTSPTGAIATAAIVNVRANASTILDSVGLIIGASAPLVINEPLDGLAAPEAQSVDINCGALGAGISSRCVLIGYTEYV